MTPHLDYAGADPAIPQRNLRRPLRLYITGPSASCKTAYSRLLADLLHVKYVSGSGLLLRELGLKGVNWLCDLDSVNRLRRDNITDVTVDSRLLQIASSSDHLVVDSCTMPWIAPRGDGDVRIWMEVDEVERTENIIRQTAGGHEFSDRKVLAAALEAKDDDTRERFRSLYGFTFGRCVETFDVSMNITHLLAKRVEDLAIERRAIISALLEEVARVATGRRRA